MSARAMRRRATGGDRRTTDYPALLAFQCKALGLPEPEREVRFHPQRRWKLDLLFRAHGLAVECDGGIWKPKSRHATGNGITGDCEKYAHALIAGIRILRVTSDHVKNGQAIAWIERLIGDKISGARR